MHLTYRRWENGRRMVRDESDGSYNVVFASGGRIYFTKSRHPHEPPSWTPAIRIDPHLEFHFAALGDPVQLARRGTDAYGGLNLRLGAVQGQRIVFHTDPVGTTPRRAWAELAGKFFDAAQPAGLVGCSPAPTRVTRATGCSTRI